MEVTSYSLSSLLLEEREKEGGSPGKAEEEKGGPCSFHWEGLASESENKGLIKVLIFSNQEIASNFGQWFMIVLILYKSICPVLLAQQCESLRSCYLL